jgi:ketosteroid isomerase-like protein
MLCQRAARRKAAVGAILAGAPFRYILMEMSARQTEDTMQKTAELKSDLEILAELNRDYIRSVQNGDVRRFDQILADDFYCSNPDGSLVDRQGFLKQTARPVTISGLAISEVKIRLIGDTAIIHARTTYKTADGRAGAGRYTDVWARLNGQWLAVSAHVTRC